MKEGTFIRLPSTAYGSYSASGELIANGIASAESAFNHRQCIVLVPTQNVLLTQVNLPKASLSKLRQAVPYAIEDHLVDEVENLHFALTTQNMAGNISIAVINLALLSEWLTQLSNLHIQPKKMLPEALALPYVSQQWQILLTNGIAIIRTGEYSGAAIEIDQLNNLVILLLHDNPPPEVINLTYSAEHASYKLASLDKFLITINYATNPTTAEVEFAHGLTQHSTNFNLLQGHYPMRGTASDTGKYWWWTSGLAIACCLIWLAAQITVLVKLQHSNQLLTNQISKLYDQIFPASAKIADPRAQINRLLINDSSSPTDSLFLDMMLSIGKQLITQSYTLTITNLEYHSGTLILEVTAADFQTLNTFANSLTAQSYHVEQSNAHTDKQQVAAQFTIKK